jgi:hypothetical protein
MRFIPPQDCFGIYKTSKAQCLKKNIVIFSVMLLRIKYKSLSNIELDNEMTFLLPTLKSILILLNFNLKFDLTIQIFLRKEKNLIIHE